MHAFSLRFSPDRFPVDASYMYDERRDDDMMMSAAPYVLLRGPLLITTVLTALSLPYLLELSIETLVCLALFVMGIIVTLFDVVFFAESSLRRRTAQFLDNLVLDNVLKSWFDPETGWMASIMAFWVGNATMYTLPTTDAQRIRLVQSSLWTSDEQARNILFAPGGFKVMLPETLQLWLYPNADVENECDECNVTEATETSEAETKLDNDDLDCDEHIRPLPTTNRVQHDASTQHVSHGLQSEREHTSAPSSVPAHVSPSPSLPQYPLQVMSSILKEIATDFFRKSCCTIPESTMQGLAVAASAAFALQMCKSPRSRQMVTGAIEGTAVLTFASVAVGAIAALITKSQVSQESSFLRIMKQASGFRRVQGMIAILVFWYVGRQRTKRRLSLHPNTHLRR